MLHHYHRSHAARDRIVDLEVMKLELRKAQVRAARANEAPATPARRPAAPTHAVREAA